MPVRRPEDISDSTEAEERPVRKLARRSTRAVKAAPVAEVEADDAIDEEPPFVPDDEDVRPDHSAVVQKGWKAADEVLKNSASTGDWINDFRWSEEPALVKFLSNEPMSYQQHWVEKTGKRGYVCLGKGCPLCEAGNTPTAKFVFSLFNLSDETEYLLVVGIRLFKLLQGHDDSPKNGPLTKLYWSLSATGKGQSKTYSIVPVKPRDLEEDWGINEADAQAVIDTYEAAGPDKIYVSPLADLKAIAVTLS